MNFLKNLIGGQIVKGYTTQGDAVTGVGHHKLWKLYKGKKDSTNTEVSIFVLEKKSLKQNKQQIIKSAKKQASNLAKIRHPGILAVVQPLIEDENNLAFVTEKVEGSLSLLLKQKKIEQYLSSELDLKLNLFPLLETVEFLHQIVKQCHLGLNFQSIYITGQGKWKIAGMNYSQQLSGQDFQSLEASFSDYVHCAPEVVNQSKFNKLSDSFSLGILFINFLTVIFLKKSFTLPVCQSKSNYNSKINQFKQFSEFPAITQSNSSSELIQLLHQLLNDESSNRLSISSLQNSKWLNDPIVLTVKYLQKISNYQNKQQVEFLKGLFGIIDKFDSKILKNRIIPVLCNLLKFSHLIASVIFILIDIIKRNLMSVDDFRTKVWSQMKTITQGKQMTAQSLYLLISNMEVLEKYVKEEDFMSTIVPLYLKCFDCPPKLKLLALKHVQRLTKKFDYQFTKTKIVPKLVNILKDQKIEIRKDALKALYSIISKLDPLTIVNSVLIGLENCRKVGADTFINSIIVEIYNKITKNMSAQILATKIMPGIMPYLVDATMQAEQFKMYKSTLMNMIDKIQMQRTKTWNTQQNQNRTIQKFTENDFILQVNIENQANKQKDSNTSARFDFLNEYTAQNQRQQPQITSNNDNLNINNGFMGTNIQPKAESYNQFIGNQANQGNQNNSNNTDVNIDFGFGFEFIKQSPSLSPKKATSSFTQNVKPVQQQQKPAVKPVKIPPVQSKPQKVEIQPKKVEIQPKKVQKIEDEFNFGGYNGFNYNNTNQSKYEPPQLFSQNIPDDDVWNIDIQSNKNNDMFGFSQNVSQTFNSNSIKSNPMTSSQPFSFDSFGMSTKTEQRKQLPVSPSTIQNTGNPKTIKGPGDIPSPKKIVGPGDISSPKKIVGPTQKQGGLKKPPKYNQFNMHLQGVDEQKPPVIQMTLNKPTPPQSKKVTQTGFQFNNPGFNFNMPQSDNPFADLQIPNNNNTYKPPNQNSFSDDLL